MFHFREKLTDFRFSETEELRAEYEKRLSRALPADKKTRDMVKKRWSTIAKPLNSLGVLEDDIADIAAMRRTTLPAIDRRALVIFCSDNGVVKEGISQTGQNVTAQVTANISRGTSCSSLMAERAGADVFPIDIGVADDIDAPGDVHPIANLTIRRSTRDFAVEPAMTERECLCALLTGMDSARVLKENGYQILAGGEMGIGNTTTSSAIVSVLLDLDPAIVTGRGAGLSTEGLNRKITVIREGIETLKPDPKDPVDCLRKIGGFDIAGMTGLFLGGAIYRVPVVIDGFIAQSAALAATRICPAARDYMIASHATTEPGCRKIFEELRLEAPIRARMCLGEGTGALMLFPILDMALAVYRDMLSFDGMGIEAYKPL